MFYMFFGKEMREHHFDYLDYNPSNRRMEPTVKKGVTPIKEQENSSDEKYCIDICSKDLIRCEGGSTVAAALKTMMKHDFRHLPVTENSKLIGIISLKDLLPHVDKPFSNKMIVRDYISKIVICCDEETPVRYLAHVLCNEKVSALLVINKQLSLIGIVSYIDVLKSMI